ncbi:MAG: hypothetical protein QM607_03790, partial [Microbacterium sp.]
AEPEPVASSEVVAGSTQAAAAEPDDVATTEAVTEPEAVDTVQTVAEPAVVATTDVVAEPESAAEPVVAPEPDAPAAAEAETPTPDQAITRPPAQEAFVPQPAPNDAQPGVVHTRFGVNITQAPSEPSFDDLLSQSSEEGGSTAAPTAVIFDNSQSAHAALSAPITATGELIVTSSHRLPEGLGSSGAAKGTTDGREVDVVLIDGEIPLASSPTPVAASSAISTLKSPSEVIKPPQKDRNQRLILTLGIVAGALGIAVVASVVIAYMNGAFS